MSQIPAGNRMRSHKISQSLTKCYIGRQCQRRYLTTARITRTYRTAAARWEPSQAWTSSSPLLLRASLINTSSMGITTIVVDIITHQHHLSNSSPGSVAVASLLTWATELPPGLKHLMYLVTDQSQVSTQVGGQLQVGGQACNVLLRSVPNITHLKLLLPTGQSRLLRCFLPWHDFLMNLCSETQLHLYNGPLELLHTYS